MLKSEIFQTATIYQKVNREEIEKGVLSAENIDLLSATNLVDVANCPDTNFAELHAEIGKGLIRNTWPEDHVRLSVCQFFRCMINMRSIIDCFFLGILF